MPNKPKPLPEIPMETDRVRDLIVCRESSPQGYVLMEGMIAQTVGNLTDVVGADEVLAAGTSPLRGDSPFKVFPFRRHKTNASLFEHRGALYLYSLGSAAARNIEGQDNAFVELLVEVINEYRPERIHVATFSRLIRSTEFSGKLQQAVKRHVKEVRCGATVIRPDTTEGKLIWAVLSMVSDMERDLIVQRLFAGRATAYLNGDWVFPPATVPPGYRLNDDGRIELDPGQVEAVKVLLALMAEPSLTSRQVVDAAGEAGLTSPTIQRFHGPDATFADLRRSDSALGGIVDWIPTYRTGVIDIYVTNPFPGAQQIAGLEVINAGPNTPGQICFRYEVGLPEGGWASEETLSAAARRVKGTKERRGTGGAMRKSRKPLVGATWQQDGIDHRLSSSAEYYTVRRATPFKEQPV